MSSDIDFDDDSPPPVTERRVTRRAQEPQLPAPRLPPHSIEAEEQLLACCMMDGADVIGRCLEAHIEPASFYLNTHAIVFERLMTLNAAHKPTELAVLSEDLKATGQLVEVGGYPFLVQVSSRIPTTAQAGYFIEQVAQYALRRELIRQGTRIVEESYEATPGDDLITSAKFRLSTIKSQDGPRQSGRSPSSFIVPPDGDPSILLGNRFLSRGDGGILVSTAGMGKSSMSIQSAYCWALGRDFFGIKPNGQLKSLIVQSEDSDGDVAEAIASMNAGMKLTDADRVLLDKNIVIVTERVRRGHRLIEELRRLIKLHEPDLVYLNPLVAFMDGDLTAAKDVGAFLREGLNSLNEPATFGYIIVHHTTKPPTDKGKQGDRTWNEVMYDMGGSYEIPGWARFVINLKATETEGEFNLVLSKRGSRAGVTRKVAQGDGFRDEVVTRIPVKWAQGVIEIPGRAKRMALVFWEPREVAANAPPEEEDRTRRNDQTITTYLPNIPRGQDKAATVATIYRTANMTRPIAMGKLADLLIDAAREGSINSVSDASGVPKYYL